MRIGFIRNVDDKILFRFQVSYIKGSCGCHLIELGCIYITILSDVCLTKGKK